MHKIYGVTGEARRAVEEIWLECRDEWANHCTDCDDYYLPDAMEGEIDPLQWNEDAGGLICPKCQKKRNVRERLSLQLEHLVWVKDPGEEP